MMKSTGMIEMPPPATIKMTPPDLESLERGVEILLRIHKATIGHTSLSDEMIELELDCLRSLGYIARTIGTYGMTEVHVTKEATKDD